MANKQEGQILRASDILKARDIVAPRLDVKDLVGREFYILNVETQPSQYGRELLKVYARNAADNTEFSFSTSNIVIVAQCKAIFQTGEVVVCKMALYGKDYQLV